MRFFLINDRFTELPGWPDKMPAQGFLWVSTARRKLEVELQETQRALQRLAGGGLVDLHVTDLLNPQLPSQYDYTSWYDLLVFRRLAATPNTDRLMQEEGKAAAATARQTMAQIDTSPVGFAVFDRVLLTVHPADCSVREFFEGRLSQMSAPGSTKVDLAQTPAFARVDGPDLMDPNSGPDEDEEPASPTRADSRSGSSRLPPSPADLMLRIINHMVDSYLDLRRLLTKHIGQLQQQLLGATKRFNDWPSLLESRNALHLLEDTCEDQRSAVQEWIDALDDWPIPTEPQAAREREVLRVRSRDVLEHIERVLGHVRRLESSAESAVQMHFSVQGSRTNDIMRTLTVLTAIFLPLNLITGIFGMNFDELPLIHEKAGAWIALGMMVSIAGVLIWLFRRKRYIDR
ncbi:MAG: magnesium transporter CorA family protein [Aquabacterium sp.]